MKANEAPKKIYIDNFGSELSYNWHTEHCYENDIEYTRTDAFIEKAVEWLEENASCYVGLADDEHPAIGDTKAFYGIKSLLYDFKRDMR